MKETIIKGATGMLATSGTFTISFLPAVEAWLRVLSLIVGIVVGIYTFISIRRINKGKHGKPDKNAWTKLTGFLD